MMELKLKDFIKKISFFISALWNLLNKVYFTMMKNSAHPRRGRNVNSSKLD